MLEDFDYWKFLAGLGIFMLGIFLMEESIKQLAGKAFKRWIRKATKTRISAILTGVGAPAVLQSSSAVSLMTLAFAGAGIMGMENAMGVVLGTNVGTTFTGWIVATLGFKVSIESLALPMIGIGGLGLIFLAKSPRFSGISKLLVGFGFLFMGLDYMKVSVEGFSSNFDISSLPDYGPLFYVLIGFILTALMQSSSATLAIILTALDAGIIPFSFGAAMVIGSNVGTTVTIMLGSIGAVPIKKQIAFSHLIFNVISGIAAFLVLPVFVFGANLIFSEDFSDVLGIALFHTFFNVLGVVLFFPFIPKFVELLQKYIPEKESPHTKFIHTISLDMPEASLNALKHETQHLLLLVLIVFEKLVCHKIQERRLKEYDSFLHENKNQNPGVEHIKSLQKNIAVYAANIQQGELEQTDVEKLHQIIHSSLSLLQISKLIESAFEEKESILSSENKNVRALLLELENRFNSYLHLFVVDSNHQQPYLNAEIPNLIIQVEGDYDSFISRITKELSNKNIENKHVSSLLALNGLMTQAIRQLLMNCHALINEETEIQLETI
jgi:phosphate:Na+ symporter